jgi:hypothetical protein
MDYDDGLKKNISLPAPVRSAELRNAEAFLATNIILYAI